MNNSNHEEQLYREAKKRVKLKRGFKTHRNVYVLTMIFLLIINIMTMPPIKPWLWFNPYMFWVQWPALGWGIGLGFHWLGVVHKIKKLDMDKDIHAEMEMLKRKRGYSKIEEGPNRDIFDMNMRNMNKEKAVEKREKR